MSDDVDHAERAFEARMDSRRRLEQEIDRLCRHAELEDHVSSLDIVAALEDCKLRRWLSIYVPPRIVNRIEEMFPE